MSFDETYNSYLNGKGNTRINRKDSLIDFFHKTPNATKYQLRQWAEENNLEEDLDVEQLAFEIISEYVQFVKGGLWNESGMPSVDDDELDMGIQLEYKHTRNVADAKRIALNNLTEIKDYYTRLIEMKKQAGLTVKLIKKIKGNFYEVTM